ncbi:MAG: response regulator [Chloroflexi bacterium]|nr:response regulator [Chloroflexota bacterium]
MTSAERRTVILVNDDQSQLRLASAILEADGLKVTACTDPLQALSAMEGQDLPDAIVTDICMPGIDGWRFCRLLRSPQYQRYNHVPVLILSANFSGADAQQLLTELGADAFLPAPYKPSDLRTQVSSLMGGRWKTSVSSLVISGDDEVARNLSQEFEGLGYDCTTAKTGEEGYRLLLERIPDMVILARDLPNRDVRRIVSEIRKQELPTVSILIADESNLPQALGSMMQGADGFVCEPFDIAELVDLWGKARRERSLVQIDDLLESKSQELRRSEVKYRLLLNSIRSPIVALTDELNVLYCNEAYADFFCGSRQELEGESIQSLIPDLSGSWLYNLYAEVLETGIWRELQHQWQGHFLHAWVYPTPWGILSVTEDVTDRKELENKVAQAEKINGLTHIAEGVAHGLNDMLTTIMGHSQLAVTANPSNGDLRNNLDEIQKAADRASTLTSHLTSFSELEPVNRKLVDINSLVLDTCNIMRRVVGEQVEISTLLRADPGLVQVDPSQIERLLLGVAAGSRGAIPGSGSIAIETYQLSVGQADRGDHPDLAVGEYEVISFTCQASGSAAKANQQIIDDSGTEEPEAEIDLAAYYDLVRDNGGYIQVNNEPGQGTTIKIYFAQADQAAASLPKSTRIEEITTNAAGHRADTVLLVDDEPLVREMTALALRDQGYNVLEAAGAGEALRIADSLPEREIQLLLTDVVMPQMNGVELATQFKASRPDSKVLLVSGNAGTTLTRADLPDKDCEFLPKPYTPEVLTGRLRCLLDN